MDEPKDLNLDDIDKVDILDGAALTTSLLMFFGGSMTAARFAIWFKEKFNHPASLEEIGHHFAAAAMLTLEDADMDAPYDDAELVNDTARKIEGLMRDNGLELTLDIGEATVRFNSSELIH